MEFVNKINVQELNNVEEKKPQNQTEPEKPKEQKSTDFQSVLNASKKEGFELVTADNKWDIAEMKRFIIRLYDDVSFAVRSIKKLKNRVKQLKEENADLQSYIEHLGSNDEGYSKWKKVQGQGRKPIQIDTRKYTLLKEAGLTQKQIAEHLGVSPNTLRARVKEMNQD